jgi:hypothetical protein
VGKPPFLRDFLYFAGTDAGRADAKAAPGAIYHCAHCLQVQIPTALGDIMSVADAITEHRTAATHFANSCHIAEISLSNES